MSDDNETTKKTLAFLAKPPKKISEMTDEEMLAWAQQLADRLDPNAGRHTPVFDDVLELNAGKITTQQLGERWAARTWLPIIKGPRTVEAVAALEASDFLGDGATGTWYEVENLRGGVLSDADYSAVWEVMAAIYEERSKG